MRPFSFTQYQPAVHNCDYSKPRRSLAILNSEKDRSALLPEHTSKLDTKKILRKYFDKKVADLICFHKSSSSASAYRCKTLKSLKVYGPSLRRDNIRLLKKMGLYYDTKVPFLVADPADSTQNRKKQTLLDQISTYKCLEYLEVRAGPQLRSLSPIKSLRNLKELSLILNINQIVENSRSFLRLKSLSKFTLTLVDSQGFQTQDQSEAVADFCVRLVALKGLQSVNLNLKAVQFSQKSKPIERLLGSLKQAELPSFHIKLNLPSQYNIETKKIQMTLDYVDLLSLTHVGGTSICVNNQKSAEVLDQSLSQAKKKLDITVSHYGIPFFTKPVQTSGPFKLFESMSSVFKKNLERSFPFLDNLHAENLRSLTFSFEKISDQNYDDLSADLAYILKNSPTLRHLDIKGLRINPFANGEHAERNQAILRELSQLSRLESLCMENISLAEESFSLVNKTLASLTNLRKLQLSFNMKFNTKVFEKFFSFEQLDKLTELKIKLPDLGYRTQASFIGCLIQLYVLQTLNIQGGGQLCKNSGLRSKLFKGVHDLGELRTAEISSDIPIYSVIGVGRSCGEDNKRIGADVKDKLEELFALSEKIEKFIVVEPNCFEVRATR